VLQQSALRNNETCFKASKISHTLGNIDDIIDIDIDTSFARKGSLSPIPRAAGDSCAWVLSSLVETGSGRGRHLLWSSMEAPATAAMPFTLKGDLAAEKL
jgi:hypothetical protein